MAERRKITGVIFSDLGQGTSFMALDWVQRVLREKLGFSPYPATLNLRLESEKETALWKEIQRDTRGMDVFPPDSSFCDARVFPVKIEGKLRGAVLLPEVKGYPADKIEVIAPVRLKDELQLQDGERIALEFVSGGLCVD
ncbi:MAG: DUF120 domain-containing protein [Candidatus Binatia bacterium]